MRRAGEREVWQTLRALVLDRNDRKREVCEALGMSFVRIKALRRIAVASIPMRDLAAALATDASYTTLVVDDLEKRGLVLRQPHPDDRRAKIIRATAAGRRLARKAETILATPPAEVRGLSDKDLAELLRILSTLLGSTSE